MMNAVERICPKCGFLFTGYPAISRVDNKTEICSSCGQSEAFEDWVMYMAKKKKEEAKV